MSPSTRSRRGTPERQAARREDLLDAVTDAIRQRGHRVSMNELADAVGVAKPILYRLFGDRAGLVVALASRFADSLFKELQATMAQNTELRHLVESTIDAYLAFVERDPEVYRFVVDRVVADQPGAAALGGFLRSIGAQVAVVLGEQLRVAGADSGGAEPLAHGIVGMVHMAGDWWLERRTMSRDRLVTYLTDAVLGGLNGMGIAT